MAGSAEAEDIAGDVDTIVQSNEVASSTQGPECLLLPVTLVVDVHDVLVLLSRLCQHSCPGRGMPCLVCISVLVHT